MKMTDRHRNSSPYNDRRDNDYDDDYSEDFDDDDDADTSNRRYKTRSPLNRTGNCHSITAPTRKEILSSKSYNFKLFGQSLSY